MKYAFKLLMIALAVVAGLFKWAAERAFSALTDYMANRGLILGAAPMRSTDFRAIVEPILNEAFDGIYDLRADEWKQVFAERTGIARAYHEEPVMYGFGAAPELPDGMPVTYQAGGILFNKRYQYKVFGLAYALTKVLVEDGDHIRIGSTYAKHLAQSLIETKETNCANILNRAFNTSYLGGDGVSLSNAAHPIIGATFSNILATPAALSQVSRATSPVFYTFRGGRVSGAKPRQRQACPAGTAREAWRVPP